MNIIQKIRRTTLMRIALFPLNKIYKYYRFCLIPEKTFIRKSFYKKLGDKLDFDNPQTFNEKLQWLKLYYRLDIMTKAADKCAVREYIKNKIGDKYLIPLWQIFDDYKDINVRVLPKSFALKATHASGWNIICHDKYKLKDTELKKTLKKWQSTNYYIYGKEWAYKNIKPRFICEKLILDENGKSPMDYKFFCFNGQPKYIQVDIDRYENHERTFYNTNWKKQSFGLLYNIGKGEIQKPEKFDEMLNIAKKLSQGFPFIRVDLYNLKGKIYFGELTFYPENGTGRFFPKKIDLELGRLIQLPEL